MKATKWMLTMLVLMFASQAGATSKMIDSTAGARYAWKVTTAQEVKEKIKKEELPMSAIQQLDDNYKGWTVVQAYRVKAQGKEEYEVEVKREAQTVTLQLDNVIIFAV